MKRRKKRATSIEAEIRKAAKQIEATRMADAYKAAALGIVARKQDEILVKQNEIAAILHAAGPFGNVAQSRPASAGVVGQVVRQQPTGPVCAQCGQPAVRQAKRNRFTAGEPAWYCRIHQALAGQVEREDAIDNALIGAQAPVVKKPPVVIQTQAPAVIVPQAVVAEPTEEKPSDALREALGLVAEVVE